MSRLIPISILILVLVAGAATAQVCQDGLWPDGEFCGHDAYIVTGDVEMNHDCIVDFIDVALFWSFFNMTGPGLSADINGDNIVNLSDMGFLAASFGTGVPVSPCNPTPAYPDFCDGDLALSLETSSIVSRGREAIMTPFTVHLIVDGWSDATALEFGINYSSNAIYMSGSSPAGWTQIIQNSSTGTSYQVWSGSSLSGTSTLISFTFFVSDTNPAWIELVDNNPSLGLLTRWTPSTLDQRSEFRVRRHVGINGIDPVCVKACPAANVPPDVAITTPATDVIVPYGTVAYDVSGTAVDTDGTLDYVEYRVNDSAWQVATGTGAWTFNTALIVGENWVQVRTADTNAAFSQTRVVSITRLDKPDLSVTDWSAPTSLTTGCGTVILDAEVTGVDIPPVTRVGFYLSADATIDAGDYLLAWQPTTAGTAVTAHQATLALPDDGPRGLVYLGAFVDDLDTVDEINETNNTASSAFDFPVPNLATVQDVRNDQGRFVRLNVPASSRDAVGSSTPVLQYEVFRRIDPLPEPAKGAGTAPFAGEQISDPAKLAGWEFAGAVPAHGEAEYNMIVPTLADSTVNGIHWSVFFVRAATVQPLVFFDSCPDSGYSVDNLAPGVPAGMVVAYAHDGNQLTWTENEEEDLHYYRVYRGTSPDFVPAPGNLEETVATAAWLDTSADPWSYHYKITAVDFAGNESAVAAPGEVTGTPDVPSTPTRYALHPCTPNPFNPMTFIKYDLPAPAFVNLTIYSTGGRLVTRLVNEMVPAGAHDVVWEGKDRFGRQVAAGVYFYRLEAGEFSETKKMVLVK